MFPYVVVDYPIRKENTDVFNNININTFLVNLNNI